MKKVILELVAPFALIIVLLATPFAALATNLVDPTDYTAKVNEEGKYCAKIEIQTVTGSRMKRKCRTIEEWEAKGYTVSSKKNQEEDAS